MRFARAVMALALAALCAGCAGGSRYASGWDGRRGYDGNGDYGYNLKAARSEAREYRARAARNYPVPGTLSDPWGPYIQEAATRFQIPPRWIREVMRQESGGHEYGSDGFPITSGAGAMGLMQVMPRTYDTLRAQYGLGDDPYDPHNNILAGAAYIRDMYAIFGSPGFLAAYNAGPDRLATYLAGSGTLPDETVNYLASIAPRLGNDVPMTGPLAAYGGHGGAVMTASTAPYPATAPASSDAAYAGGGMVVQTADAGSSDAAYVPPDDPADRAFDGGGLVTAAAPTGVLTAPYSAPPPAPSPSPTPAAPTPAAPAPAAPAPAAPIVTASLPPPPMQPAPQQYAERSPPPHSLLAPASLLAAVVPRAEAAEPHGGQWAIQVGAFPDPAHSQAAVNEARARAADLLGGTQPAIIPVQRDGVLYRARLVGLSAAAAAAACGRLSGAGMACFTVPPGS
jgi:soluble lytic murein transglycosylase-like protein